MKVKSLSKRTSQTYDFEVKGKHQYLMANGVVSHNTSTSIFMDAAAGVMPVWNGFFYEDNGNGLSPVVGMHIKENPLSYGRNLTRFNPWDLTKVTSWVQRFVDTGVSAEYLMDKNREDISAKFLYDTIQDAWKNKTKAVYYIRNLKKGENLVRTEEGSCVGCAG